MASYSLSISNTWCNKMTFNLHFKAANVPSQKLYLPRNVNLARLDCVPRTGCLAHASSSRTFAVRSYEVSAPRISEDCDFEFLIQCTTSSEDLIQAAWLRAEAYHEVRTGQHCSKFKLHGDQSTSHLTRDASNMLFADTAVWPLHGFVCKAVCPKGSSQPVAKSTKFVQEFWSANT